MEEVIGSIPVRSTKQPPLTNQPTGRSKLFRSSVGFGSAGRRSIGCQPNLSDEELKAIARTGGVVGIGIGYWETATCGKDADAVARAMIYTANAVGFEHVASGSDFDGATVTPFDATGVPLITEALLRRGVPQHHIQLTMGRNVLSTRLPTLPG